MNSALSSFSNYSLQSFQEEQLLWFSLETAFCGQGERHERKDLVNLS